MRHPERAASSRHWAAISARATSMLPNTESANTDAHDGELDNRGPASFFRLRPRDSHEHGMCPIVIS